MTKADNTIGTTETFDPERIKRLLNKGIVSSIPNLEKAIFALEYLGQLQKEGLDLIFKGGSAVQILLGARWNRLSVDIDICTDTSEKELESILDRIYHKFDDKAFSYNRRPGEISSAIPFYLYKIDTPALTERSRTFLLDVIGIKPKFPIQKTPLKTFFFDSSIKVITPTISSILGDKLSIIGPTTIGRPLNDSRNGLEYAKHFYDINCLQETKFNVKECTEAFYETVKIQSKVRGRDFTKDECFADMLFTCQVASLPQRLGQQAIKILENEKASRATSEFRVLQDGLRRLRTFLIRNISYTWDDLRYYASRTALIMKMIKNNTSEDKVEEILYANTPISREDILKLIGQVKTLPEEER